MGREILFRAWNKNKQKLIYFKEGIFNKKPYTETSTFSQYESSPKYHELDIMQYIGQKDRNGKKIFEGDRVKIWHRYNNTLEDLHVHYRDCNFVATSFKNPQINYWLGGDGYYSIEVIGNIYDEVKNG